MNARRQELLHRLQPLDSNTCMAEEIGESVAQRFAGICYLLEAGDGAVARGTRGFLQIAQAKDAAREGIREARRLRTCGCSKSARRSVDQRAGRNKSRRT